jgi:hypothetical protein
MRRFHIILPCGHVATLPRRWLTCTCPVCGAKWENA